MNYLRSVYSRHLTLMKLLITSGAFLCLPACEDEKPDEPPVSAVTDSSASMIVPRSDSTSHRYSWRTWFFGDGGFEGSAWLGVSAINENNAIVVGHIAQRDSIYAQHAVKWDGTSWKYFYVYMQYIQLQYVDPDSGNFPIGTIHHVWGEPPNNWTFAVSQPIYFEKPRLSRIIGFTGAPIP